MSHDVSVSVSVQSSVSVCVRLQAADKENISAYVFCSSSSSFLFIMAMIAWRSSTAETGDQSEIYAQKVLQKHKTHTDTTHTNMYKLITYSFQM